jgi:hypothetical protein
VDYLDLLAAVHPRLAPRTYVEIGVRDGSSLAPSRARSIAIDPEFAVKQELRCDLHLVKATSDEYFARTDALHEFGGERISMGFIDGLHLFEFALRDFINIEAHSQWWSVVIFDDTYPRLAGEAVRGRTTVGWTGDVYKNLLILAEYRPDLILLPVHTSNTGLLVVLGADPDSTVLRDSYDDIETRYLLPDPQDVPAYILERSGSWSAAALAVSPLWDFLRDARENNVSRDEGLPELRRLVADLAPAAAPDFTADPVPAGDLRVWPPVKKKPATPASGKSSSPAPRPAAGLADRVTRLIARQRRR